jgi:hypothetical protein
MILNEFKNKYLGKQVEYHSNGGSDTWYQCVDLVNQYIKELGLTPIIGTNAKDFKDRFNKEEFDWIPNNPNDDKFPQPGDIVVWNGNVGGGAGHIAIALNSSPTGFTSLDQNWSKKQVVTTENHNYNNVSGWLHPKENMAGLPENYPDIIHNSVQWEELHKYLELPGEPKSTQAEAVINSIGGLKSRATDLQNQLAKTQAEVKNREEQVSRLKEQIANEQTLNKALTTKLNDAMSALKTLAGDYEGRIGVLQEQVNDLAKDKGELNKQIALLQAGQQDCFDIFLSNIKKLFKKG